MQPVDCNHYIPCSGILQPQSEQDLRQWSPCIGWSFGSEPEPSEARVSPATHDVYIGLHALVGQIIILPTIYHDCPAVSSLAILQPQ